MTFIITLSLGTCLGQIHILVVEHDVWTTISNKELLHSVNLSERKKERFLPYWTYTV